MYMREKNNDVNLAETISQILSETENVNLSDLGYNVHVKMMFDAALEYVVRHTKVLSWNYGAVYTCLQCKEKNQIFGSDCILFSSDKHVLKNEEISLDDTLIRTRLVPKIQCKNRCEGYTFTRNARYSIFAIPQFVFVTLATNIPKNKTNATTTTATTTIDRYTKKVEEQIYIKCDLIQTYFLYSLCCFIVITKDERALLIKPISNNQYSVYNNDTKDYESLVDYQFDDFVAASTADIVLCYKTHDTPELNPTLIPTTLDMEQWTAIPNMDSSAVTAIFTNYMSSFNEPLQLGSYQLKSYDITQLIKSTHELTDEQLNAHLYVTTTLSHGILLFDSILFTRYCHRGFRKTSEIINNEWFNSNIILIPVHHLHHWFLFIIDITKQTIIRFDSLPTKSTPYQKYQNAVVQLLRIHYFYTKKTNINLNSWKFVCDFKDITQDDTTSCGIHCGLFARYYVTATKYPKINKQNISEHRMEFALRLLHSTKQ